MIILPFGAILYEIALMTPQHSGETAVVLAETAFFLWAGRGFSSCSLLHPY